MYLVGIIIMIDVQAREVTEDTKSCIVGGDVNLCSRDKHIVVVTQPDTHVGMVALRQSTTAGDR